MLEFELNLCVTPSTQNTESTYAESINFSQSSLSCCKEENTISFYSDTLENEIEACKQIETFYLAYKRRKRLKIFIKKMNARKRFGQANIIKRAIIRKGMKRRTTNAYRLYRLVLIGEKLQKKKSIYY
jgi:hypothetical protein